MKLKMLAIVLVLTFFVTHAQAFTLMWKYETDGYMDVSDTSSSPCLEDVDGDGKLEIVFASFNGKVYALRDDGTVLWKHVVKKYVFNPLVEDGNHIILCSPEIFDLINPFKLTHSPTPHRKAWQQDQL